MAVIICSTPTKPPRVGSPVKGLLPLIAPSLVLVFFFAIPMGMMIGISFQSPTEGSPTLASYSRFFSNDLVLAGLARTVVMSGLVAFCVTVLAYPLAYYLARSTSRWRTVIFALAIAPELAGVVLRTYGWLIILEDRGFINSALMWTGLITEPLPLSKNLLGVVVGLTHVILPFGVLSLLTSLQSINPNLEKSAQILGASRLAAIRHIILPLSVPGIVSSFLIGFTMAASAYATPALLGGAGFKVMATMVYEQVLFYLDWPFAAVMANVLLILMLAAGFVGSRLESRLHQKLHL
ncbi:ABC transporter permease [Ensifer adhaerens]|nr:ABC transporter permease [Ensifer adhaerens]UAY03062.1 ABC transporter permease [Ensifer adhaerens]UAY11047.1 ABC transporter permease [Ensifer adhaerens]